ncbi:MAG: hypothetical protein A2X23_03850 [Chloroflexi bacterium GWC2_73_18]|nr:MAG: hypothetical protein A2X23_03850 [Chloroflexi bacterium GWC2_73_18]
MSTEEIRVAMARAIGYLAEHPDEARYTDSWAMATWEGELRCAVAGPGGERLAVDMPKGVGGGAAAPSPGWILRAAAASCDVALIAMRAAQLGVELSRLEVTADSESDDRGILGMDQAVPAGPLSSRTRITIAAEGVPEETLRDIVRWADEHAPVGDAIRRAVPRAVEVEIG